MGIPHMGAALVSTRPDETVRDGSHPTCLREIAGAFSVSICWDVSPAAPHRRR